MQYENTRHKYREKPLSYATVQLSNQKFKQIIDSQAMSQSTLERHFNLTREEPVEKKRKQLSINLFAAHTNNVLDTKVEKDEIITIATTACLPTKSKIRGLLVNLKNLSTWI